MEGVEPEGDLNTPNDNSSSHHLHKIKINLKGRSDKGLLFIFEVEP